MVVQVFVGDKPVQDRFEPVRNRDFIKPEGGLWTSTYLGDEDISGWVNWCRYADFGIRPFKCYLMIPRKDARIYTIDSIEDLKKLMEKYERDSSLSYFKFIDFEKMARDYDGIRLTDRGQFRTRFSEPYNLYGWDCECILWLNWCFESVSFLGEFDDIEGGENKESDYHRELLESVEQIEKGQVVKIKKGEKLLE